MKWNKLNNMKKSLYPRRIIEIDMLRAIALILMIVYHVIFDLYYYFDISVSSFFWNIIGKTSAILFLMLVGVSFSISYRRRFSTMSRSGLYKKYFRDGLIVFCYGMILTLFTWFLDETSYIKFGILHQIGLAKMILPFFARNKLWLNTALAIMILLSAIPLHNIHIESNWFFWLGFPYENFNSLDYYPLLPWFGWVLLGYVLGNILYVKIESYFKLKNIFPLNILTFFGRNSLLIYLVHQPLIFLLLYLFL